MNKVDENLKKLIIAEAKRVIELLEMPVEEQPSYYAYDPLNAELKGKMKELRRDTIRLEKQLKY